MDGGGVDRNHPEDLDSRIARLQRARSNSKTELPFISSLPPPLPLPSNNHRVTPPRRHHAPAAPTRRPTATISPRRHHVAAAVSPRRHHAATPSPRRRHHAPVRTRPLLDGEVPAMDDEELHSLLGV